MSRHYFNTTREQGELLLQFDASAARQEDVIFAYFAAAKQATPSDVLAAGILRPETPITSVRRAITQLTRAGKLCKTETKRDGMYGRPEHVWEVAA